MTSYLRENLFKRSLMDNNEFFSDLEIKEDALIQIGKESVVSSDNLFLKIKQLTPVGMECIISSQDLKFLNLSDNVYVFFSDGRIYEASILLVKQYIEDQKIIGIRFFNQIQEKYLGVDRRASFRWVCPNDFLPTCVSVNPTYYNDYVFFKIKDISEYGLRLITLVEYQSFMVGEQIDLLVNLPMISHLKISVLIKNIRIFIENKKEYFSIGVEFIDLHFSKKAKFIEYFIAVW